MFFVALFVFSRIFSSSNQLKFEKNTENYNIKQAYGDNCDPECWFLDENSEINSTTILSFPTNCTAVCGRILFTSESDLSIYELTSYFKNLKIIYGSLIFEKTKYMNVGFLKNLEEVYCEHYYGAFSFYHNKYLVSLNLTNLKNVSCDLYFYSNSKLDIGSICDTIDSPIVSYENLQNCDACVGGTINVDSVAKYENCVEVTAGVRVTDIFVGWGTDMSGVANIEKITGSFEIYNTDAENITFFKSLKTIKTRLASRGYNSNHFHIEKNYQLKRLGAPNLTELIAYDTEGVFYVFIDNNNETFCLTTQEVQMFITQRVKFSTLHADYCADDENSTVSCIFESMKDLPNGCVNLRGFVKINKGDEEYVDKLKTVNFIFGSLTIEGTTLTDLSFLRQLQYVANLKENSTSAIQISSNTVLKDTSLPSLKRAYSKSKYQIEYSNNMIRTMNSSSCSSFRDSLFFTSINFDGYECEVITRIETSDHSNGARNVINIWLITLFLVIFFE